MKSSQDLFKKHCGPRFEKFMEAIYVNARGAVELKFWQERVVRTFLAEHPELNLDQNSLLALIRDGTEMRFKCPEARCWGNVMCFSRKSDEWSCDECDRVWVSKSALIDAIEEAEIQ